MTESATWHYAEKPAEGGDQNAGDNLSNALSAELVQQLADYQRSRDVPAHDSSSDRPQQNRLDAALEAAVDATAPGAAVVVLKDGKVIYQSAAGKSNLETDESLKVTDRFDLASVSKQFTAMAVLILVDRGMLSLDDDIRKFLPELKTGHKITVAQLLNMTAGLPEYTTSDDLDPNEATNREILDYVNKKGLVSFPGEKFEYTNTNYVLLSMIVEAAAQEKFKDFMQREIFDPLGMNATSVVNTDDAVPNRVTGYHRDKGQYKHTSGDSRVTGDGEMVSTVIDLARWDAELHQPTLVSEETLQRAFESGRLNNGKATGYGYGWSVSSAGEPKVVEHSGSWNGTSTYIRRDLDSGITVIVLSNNQGFDSVGLGRRLARRANSPRH